MKFKFHLSVILLTIFFIVTPNFSHSQTNPTDCSTAILICGNTNLKLNSKGTGIDDFRPANNFAPSCQFVESQSVWIKIIIDSAGSLGFNLKPDAIGSQDDYDFAIYGPNVRCDSLGRSIRCSSTNPQAAMVSTSTGLRSSETDLTEGPGFLGNGYVSSLTVKAGEVYYILIDNFSQQDGFDLNWTGTAKLIKAPKTKQPKTVHLCDTDGTDDGATLFHLAPLKDTIIGNQKNVSVSFYASENDAVLNRNALDTNYRNTSNPQTIYAKASSINNSCTKIVSFNLNVNRLHSVEVSNVQFCDDNEDGIKTIPADSIIPYIIKNKNPVTYDISFFTKAQNAWQNQDQITSLTNTTPGGQVFFGRITNKNTGCWDTFSFTLEITALPKPELGMDRTICPGDTVLFDIKEVYDQYEWNDGTTTPDKIATDSGTYWVHVWLKGCQTGDTVRIELNKNIELDLGSDTSICEGDTLILDAKNADKSHLWNTGRTTQTYKVWETGTYIVEVSDNICTQKDSIFVEVELPITVNLGKDTNICIGDSLKLDASNGNKSFLWSTGETTQSIWVQRTGSYTVQVIGLACTATDDINVTAFPIPQAYLGGDTTLCKTLYTLSSKCQGCSHTWSTGDTGSTIRINSSGNYSVELLRKGCKNSADINIRFIDIPLVDLGPDTTLCDDIIELDAENEGNIYSWSTGETTQRIQVKKSGIYTVYAGLPGCEDSDEIKVTIYKTPNFSLGEDTILCENETLRLYAPPKTAGYLHEWEDGTNNDSRIIKETGEYALKLFNTTCARHDTISVTFTPKPNIPLGTDTFLCIGDSLILNAGSDGDRFKWNTRDTTRNLTVKKAGFYAVTAFTGRCFDSSNIIINPRPKPIIPIKDTFRICLEKKETIIIQPDDNRIYYWRPQYAWSNKIEVDYTGLLLCYYKDTNQCSTNKFIHVIEACDPYLWVPSAFTPDKNKINETFKPVGDYINKYRFQVYNRWGERLFETKNLNEGWDGTYLGKECPQDVYIWLISYEGSKKDGTDIGENLKGNITLLRNGSE